VIHHARYLPTVEHIPYAYLSKIDKGEDVTQQFREYCEPQCVRTQEMLSECMKSKSVCMNEYMAHFDCVHLCVAPKVFKYLQCSSKGDLY